MKLQFPTMLRKMWSGGEVQEWIDDQLNKSDLKIVNDKQEKALKDLLHVVDGMCDCYRKENYGEAKEWVRHVNDAYTNYQESLEDDSV